MNRLTPAWFFILLLLFVPVTTQAQTRLFQPGDSGVTTTLDFLLVKKNYYGDTFGILRGSYTYHGTWDLGVEYGNTDFHNEGKGLVFFGNWAVINPAPGDKWGLEVGVQYSDQMSESNLPPVRGFFIPYYDRVRFQNLQPGLKGFLRDRESDYTLGLGGFYGFRKYEILAPTDEVLYGQNYGLLGFEFEFHDRLWGKTHLSLTAEYAQYRRGSTERWEFSAVLSFGILWGFNTNEGGGEDE